MMLSDAEIVRVENVHGPDVHDRAATIEAAITRHHAIVFLGVPKGKRSFLDPSGNILYCGDAYFEKEEVGEYSSMCYGDGWNARVIYRVNGDNQSNLNRVSRSVNEAIHSQRVDRNLYRLFTYPLFIYLFLCISFVVWLFVKAVRFVKAG